MDLIDLDLEGWVYSGSRKEGKTKYASAKCIFRQEGANGISRLVRVKISEYGMKQASQGMRGSLRSL